MSSYETIEIYGEEIARQLNSRPGGRRAGRGDSLWTQERYEESYGIDREGEE